MRHAPRGLVAAVVLLAVAACGDEKQPEPPRGNPYLYTPPPAGPAPAGLEASTWTAHLEADLMPYWMMEAARGTPEGNFPTYRTMTGGTTSEGARKPRMLGRQTYGYAVAYLMTGEPQYLELARSGTRFILDHAWDTAYGGWHADLDGEGAPAGGGSKFAQDFSYTAMGPAAYFFVTRDPEAEEAVLDTRDLLFDPSKYWDAPGARIRDGMDATLVAEAFLNGAGNSNIVSQLDPITAFLLLVQPVLSDPAERVTLLGQLEQLATAIRTRHFADGLFWGTTGGLGQYGGPHSDFGHALKAHWALTQLDKRLADQPFQEFLSEYTAPSLTRALDPLRMRWKKRPTSATSDEYGSDWWSYAECDQLAATLALHDPEWLTTVAQTSARWRLEYVDTSRAAREILPGITWEGYPAWSWPDEDTAKCNQWKSAFHSTEHALVMFLLSHYAAGTPAPLYFAFPAEEIAARVAASKPYTFEGAVLDHEDLGEIPGTGLHKVRIRFVELR